MLSYDIAENQQKRKKHTFSTIREKLLVTKKIVETEY